MSISTQVRVQLPAMAVPSPTPSPVATTPRWQISTPHALWISLVGVALAFTLFGVCLRDAVARANHAAQTIGRDSVPSIVAAQEISQALARSHAAATDAWLAVGVAHDQRLADSARDLDRAAEALVNAASNITYGEEERAPILILAQKTRTYAELMATARAQSDASALVAAGNLLHHDVLPAAQALETANFNHLEAEYERSRHEHLGNVARVLFGLVAATGSLAGLSVLMSRRFRRLVNLGVLVAGVVIGGLGVAALSRLHRAREAVRVAKADAFDSYHAISRARTLLHDASADEALFLVFPDRDGDRGFQAKVDAIALSPTATDVAMAERGHPSYVNGLLGEELRNVTFPGERAAATRALVTFREFLAADRKLRALETEPHHSAAVARRLEGNEGVAGAVARTEKAFADVAQINRDALDRAIGEAFEALAPLSSFAVWLPIGALVLVWLGVRPRLREYRA